MSNILKGLYVAEGAPELLKAEMPLVRHIERELAQHGYEKGTPEYDQMFKHAMAMYRKFGNIDAIKQGVAEGDPGTRYKVKQIGHDAGGDYYISPSTGKKVYKPGVKRGDHENPNTGEIKSVVKAKHFSFTKEEVSEGQLELNTPDPVVVIQDKSGNILDRMNLSVAAQKYKLGQPQNIKNQLAHQNYTTVGNYIVVSPMGGQPQDKTTSNISEDSTISGEFEFETEIIDPEFDPTQHTDPHIPAIVTYDVDTSDPPGFTIAVQTVSDINGKDLTNVLDNKTMNRLEDRAEIDYRKRIERISRNDVDESFIRPYGRPNPYSATDENKPRIRKYTYERPDGSVATRYEVLDSEGRRVSGQRSEGFDNIQSAKELLRNINESQIYSGGNKEAGVHWYKPRHVPNQNELENLEEDLRKWFKEKWVRFGPDGKIRGACARGDDSEGKPKCLPQAKAHALGKKGRKYAASKKRREDPNPERSGKAINVNTKKKSNEGVAEGFMGNVKDTELKNIDPDNHNKGEGDFVKNQLHTIKRVVTHLENSIGNEEDLPDWVQSEIAKATDKIVNVMDYSISKKEQDIGSDSLMKEQGVAEAELDEACWKGYHKEGNKKMFGKTYPNCVKNTNEEQLDEKCWDTHKQVGMKSKGGKMVPNCVPKESVEEAKHSCPHCGGPMFEAMMMNEKKDACYYKVKSRYKVWPSAYASGALVQCRKKGAKNWGTKSEGMVMGASSDASSAGTKVQGEAANPAQQAAIAIAMKKAGKKPKKESAIMKGIQFEGNDEEFHTGGSLGTPYPSTYEQETLPYRTKGQKRTQAIAFEDEQIDEKWSEKYKRSIDCSHPKGFSQRAHCQGRKKK